MTIGEVILLCFMSLLLILVVANMFITLLHKKEKVDYSSEIQEAVNRSMKMQFEILADSLKKSEGYQSEQLKDLNERVKENLNSLNQSIQQTNTQVNESLDKIHNRLEQSIKELQNQNEKKLDEMRNVVDEKLEKTLNNRISESFDRVVKQLQEVSKAVGEMQSIASDVSSLQKVLTNVKTKGILGEVQLGNILQEILTPDQYETNIITKKGSHDPVEFAIKLPGEKKETPVFLPIDSKFPLQPYQELLDAYDKGEQEEIKKKQAALKTAIKSNAKAISSKYLDVPNTTDFGIMFLPIEGLYAEVLKLDLVETLTREYKINVAGPSTMAALLNALSMGFKTLAIQKRSSEVFTVLAEVKKEFDNFSGVLLKAQENINKAQEGITTLITTRSKKINSALRKVESIEEIEENKVVE